MVITVITHKAITPETTILEATMAETRTDGVLDVGLQLQHWLELLYSEVL
jgi:hypothetical protein